MSKKRSVFILQLWLVLVSILIIGCASTPDVPVSAPNAGTTSKPLLTYALSLQGRPYRYGKDTPEEGFDCSGFVRHVYRRQGILLPRTSREMAATLPTIPKKTLQPGDLVFFNIDGKVFSHVGIYINDDDFIHAPSQRTGKVTVSNLKNDYWHKRFMGVRRPSLNRAAN